MAMGSESTLTLPVIDFSLPDLNPGSPNYNFVKSQLQKAVEDFGCFSAVLKFPQELHSSICSSLEDIFNLPLEVKERNSVNTPPLGYVGRSPSAPFVESVGFSDPTVVANVDSMINVLWPEGNPEISKTIQTYSNVVLELQKLIRRMIMESLGLEKYMDEHMNSTDYALKLLKYDPPSSSEKKLGLRPHSDRNVITILHDNQVGGLEIQTKDGQWIPVKTTPDSFIVLVGESLAAWTNDRVYATPHRVMMTGNTERYSLAFFTIYKKGYIVKAPEELVDEQHPLVYKPFDYSDYFKVYREQISIHFLTIKSYCGA